MKTILGTDNLAFKRNFVKMAMDEGIDEFFFGYMPENWLKNYGWTVCCNRRQFGSNSNFSDMKEVEKLIELCKENNKKIFLALNEHEYINDQLGVLKPVVYEIEKLGVDGFIIGNLALMLAIRDWGINAPIHVSIAGSCINPEVIYFYKKNISKVTRCILPRNLTMDEITELSQVAKSQNIELEAFSCGKCTYDDDHCFTVHSNSFKNDTKKEIGTWCHSSMHGNFKKTMSIPYKNEWKKLFSNLDNTNLSDINSFSNSNLARRTNIPDKRKIYEAMEVAMKFNQKLNRVIMNIKQGKPYFQGVHFEDNETDIELLMYMTLGPCSLCSINRFKEIGIDSIKVPLRGNLSPITYLYIKIVKVIIESDGLTPEILIKLMNNKEYCSGLYCYYNYPSEI